MLFNIVTWKKGLRQGDPLSPMLFNIVDYMLAIISEDAKNDGQIEWVIPCLVDGGLSILQYIDIGFSLWSMIFKRQEIWN
jgi:hypothetical protein